MLVGIWQNHLETFLERRRGRVKEKKKRKGDKEGEQVVVCCNGSKKDSGEKEPIM